MASVNLVPQDVKRRISQMAATNGPNGAEVQNLYRQWGARYSAANRRAFRQNSQGGGDWPPLQPSTIARRRAGRGAKSRQTIGGLRREGLQQARTATTDRQGRSAVRKLKRAAAAVASTRILIDTGALFNTLTLGAPGNLFNYITDGVRFGVSGKARRRDSKLTLGDLATLHSTGAGNLPKRPVLIKPSEIPLDTRRGMMRDLQAFMSKIKLKIGGQ